MKDRGSRNWAAVAFGGMLAVVGASIAWPVGVQARQMTPAKAAPLLNPAALPAGNAERGQAAAVTCQGCHGLPAFGNEPEYPRLAAQHPVYLSGQLLVYRAGLRKNVIMNAVAAKLSDQNIADLAVYFSRQKVGAAWSGQNPALVAQGAKLYAVGAPERGVIACQVCHGMQGNGVNELGVALIRHQSPAYAVSVLHEFQALGTRGNPQSTAMYLEAKALSETELKALAAYLASMP